MDSKSMDSIGRKYFFVCYCSLLLIISCGTRNSESTMVAAAANTQFAMKEVVKEFETRYNIPCELIISSSGKLTAQLLEGAPYDIFLSADMHYPQLLYEKKISLKKPKIYARGKTAIISSDRAIEPLISSLRSKEVMHIAIANPETAPYGKATKLMLQNLGMWKSIESKIVYGESIAQVNQFVFSGAAQLGFTSLSSALAPQLADKVAWKEIESKHYSVIEQGIVIVNNSEAKSAQCKKFYNFLFSEEGQNIFSRYGYAKGDQ